jgi:hypothetical protein
VRKARKNQQRSEPLVIAGAALVSESSSVSESDGEDSDASGHGKVSGSNSPANKRKSPKKHPRRSDGSATGVVVAISGVEDDRDSLRGIVVALGGKITDEVFGRTAVKPTHLVAEGDAVSPKILLSLGLGIPILRPAWVYSSLSAGKWLPVDGQDADGVDFFVVNFDQDAWKSRQAMLYRRDPRMLEDRPTRGAQFLQGTVVFFAGSSFYPDNSVFSELVQLVGGDVVRNSETPALSVVVLMEPQAVRRGRLGADVSVLPAKLAAHVPVVTTQWIVDCIAQCAALPFDAYLAKGVRKPVPLPLSESNPSDSSPPLEQMIPAASSDDNNATRRGARQSQRASALTGPPGRQTTGGAISALAASPGTPQNAILLALKKRSPGPASAVKDAARQWSTQQLRQSLSPDASDSD